ncbi:MAG: hypothetical protein HN970_09165, partial [Rhodospirillaceae bacterium]|nr:hypothetical protein [Rhodospirillaceae bacterium]
PVGSVVVGGIGTIAVALIFAKYFPNLRRVDALEADHVMAASEKAAAEAGAA